MSAPEATRRRSTATAQERLGLVERQLVEEGYAPRTVDHYLNELRRAELWCEGEGFSLLNVPADEIARYVNLRPKNNPVRTQLKVSLGHYWRILKRRNPPLWVVRVPSKRRMVCRALEEDEARALAADALAWGGREGLAVLLGLYQGLRREEIASVAWSDFKNDGWMDLVGKGEHSARLPVHPVVAEALAKLPRTHDHWVFPGRKVVAGRPNALGHVTPATIWQWVKLVGSDLDIKDLHPHRLRHTALATANDNTGDLRAVQDLARHAKIETTAGYTRTLPRRLTSVVESIAYGCEGPPDLSGMALQLAGEVGPSPANDAPRGETAYWWAANDWAAIRLAKAAHWDAGALRLAAAACSPHLSGRELLEAAIARIDRLDGQPATAARGTHLVALR